MWFNYPGIKLEPALGTLEDKIEHLSSYAHVVHTTAKQVISRHKMKNARAKRAKIMFFIVKYANLWGFCCRRPHGCLSSLTCDAERCFWLRKLICEIDKKGGTFCPPNTLYQICVGIQRYLRENENADMDIIRNSRCKINWTFKWNV